MVNDYASYRVPAHGPVTYTTSSLFTDPTQPLPTASTPRPPNGQKVRQQKASRAATAHELNATTALFTPTNAAVHHFKFLSLPFELREKIYRHLLIPDNGRIRRPHAQCRQGKSVNISIILTCKALYTESRNILPRYAQIALPMRRTRITGYQISVRDQIALFKFRRVVLEWYLVKQIDYKETGQTSMTHAVRQTLPLLRMYELSLGETVDKELTMWYRPAYKEARIEELEERIARFHVQFEIEASFAAPNVKLELVVGKPVTALGEELE
jgi:hypothetical protein